MIARSKSDISPIAYLKNPSNFSNDPLHRAQIEEHGEHEADEVEDAQRLEDEDRVHRVALVDGRHDLEGDRGLVGEGSKVEGGLFLAT